MHLLDGLMNSMKREEEEEEEEEEGGGEEEIKKKGGKPKRRWKIGRECRMEKIGARKQSRGK
jgi:hypothetical protein